MPWNLENQDIPDSRNTEEVETELCSSGSKATKEQIINIINSSNMAAVQLADNEKVVY